MELFCVFRVHRNLPEEHLRGLKGREKAFFPPKAPKEADTAPAHMRDGRNGTKSTAYYFIFNTVSSGTQPLHTHTHTHKHHTHIYTHACTHDNLGEFTNSLNQSTLSLVSLALTGRLLKLHGPASPFRKKKKIQWSLLNTGEPRKCTCSGE